MHHGRNGSLCCRPATRDKFCYQELPRGLEQGLTMSDNMFMRGEPIDHLKVTIYDGESTSDCENRRLGLQLRG